MRGRNWQPDEKLSAAYTYVLTGSTSNTSVVTGISERTLKDWIKTDWFQDLMLEAKERKQEELDGQWTGLIHNIAIKLEERVRLGDPVVDSRTKEVVYVPVKAKDLAIINSILIDKRAMARGQATSRVEKISTQDQLDKIQEKLSKVSIADDESPIHSGRST